MLQIKEAIVVEGRYDKNTLSQVVDTVILETSGFGVFKNQELVALLRRLAETRGLIVLTDSDGAGFVIRNYLKGSLKEGQVKQAYIPDVYGKERRKKVGGKEGKVGVEGMPPDVIEDVLRRGGATFVGETATQQTKEPMTKTDLFFLGLTGTPDASQRRSKLLKELNFPEHMTPNALLPVLNALYSQEELEEVMSQWN